MITEQLLETVGKRFPLRELDAGEYGSLKVSGMKFRIRAFRAEGLGTVSIMTASGFFGLMNMDTLIITPTEVDLPLFSYDRVLAMGNDTLIVELYDTLLMDTDLSALQSAKDACRELPEHDLGSHWYDSIKLPQSLSTKGKKQHTTPFDRAAEAYLAAFLTCAEKAAPCEAAPKQENASVYVEGLLTHGGPSTDVFKKAIGPEKTAHLFRRILFRTE